MGNVSSNNHLDENLYNLNELKKELKTDDEIMANNINIPLEKEVIRKVNKHYTNKQIQEFREKNKNEIKNQMKLLIGNISINKNNKKENKEKTQNVKNFYQNKEKAINNLEKHLEGIVRINATIMNYDIFNPFFEGEKNVVSGTAFFISSNYLVSCYHVVKNAIKIEIKINDRRYNARIVSFCENLDIVLLNVKNVNSKHFFELDNSDFVRMNDMVYTYGYPLGSDNLKITAGIVSGFQDDKIQIDAPINPGNSGGPLFNDKGMIIGINTAVMRSANNIGFASQINYFKNLFYYRIVDGIVDEKAFKLLNKFIIPKYFHFETTAIPDELIRFNSEIEGGVIVTKVIDIDKFSSLQPYDMVHSSFKRTMLKKLYEDNNSLNTDITETIKLIRNIKEGDIITSIGDYKINRLGLCYKDNNANRKVPFDSILNNFSTIDLESNVIPIRILKPNNGVNNNYVSERYILDPLLSRYVIMDITNLLPIRYEYDRVIKRDKKNLINLDGVLIQQLNLNHIMYIVENGLFLNFETQFIKFLDYVNIDRWTQNVLFISYIERESNKQYSKNIVAGDIITHINGKKVSTLQQLQKQIKEINKSEEKIFYIRTMSTRIYFENRDDIILNMKTKNFSFINNEEN